MNEVAPGTFEVSVKYRFHVRELTWSNGEKGFDWWEEVTSASSNDWYSTYEEALRNMKQYMYEQLRLDY